MQKNANFFSLRNDKLMINALKLDIFTVIGLPIYGSIPFASRSHLVRITDIYVPSFLHVIKKFGVCQMDEQNFANSVIKNAPTR